MDKDFNYQFDASIRTLCKQIAIKYGLDADELLSFLYTEHKDIKYCKYASPTGINCKDAQLTNGYCVKHQNIANLISTSIKSTTPKTTKTMTKTQKDIIDWLNTATPKQETVLYQHELGLLDKESELVFNEDYIVIGKLENNKLGKLLKFDIELCEKMSWEYDESAVFID